MSRPNVLLIDACDAARYRLRLALKSLGADVRQARSVEAALPSLHAQRPDLIITAPTLPGMNALDLLALLRSGTSETPPPVVVHCPDGIWPLADAATAQGALAVVCGDALRPRLGGWLQQAAASAAPTSGAHVPEPSPPGRGSAAKPPPMTWARPTHQGKPTEPAALMHCWGQALAAALVGLLIGLWIA